MYPIFRTFKYSGRSLILIGFMWLGVCGGPAARAEDNKQKPSVSEYNSVKIKVIPVNGTVYMLTGKGGNIGMSIGGDGVFLIDDQFAPLNDKIRSAIRKLTGKPIKFLLNTHWHADHTGGNFAFAQSGTLIIAHDDVRKRLSSDQFIKAFAKTVPASPTAALPMLTFDQTMTLHYNGEEIHAFHVDPAHTDGDTIVHFRDSNVVHMGDIFFNGMYPFIDESSGGSLLGMINAVEHVLPMTDDETKIIPGHGPLGDAASLRAYLGMLRLVKNRINRMIKEELSLDTIIETEPLAEFEDTWGSGFLNAERFIRIVYSFLTQNDKISNRPSR